MKTIHKHELRQVDNTFETFEGARVVHVASQYERPMAWLEVDTDAPTRSMTLHVVGTGNPIPLEADRHLGTAISHHGILVLHVYSHRSLL